MKKITKLFGILALVGVSTAAVAVGATGCSSGKTSSTPLKAPEISLNQTTGEITWSEVENATVYYVYESANETDYTKVKDVAAETNKTTYSYTISKTETTGSWTYYVKADSSDKAYSVSPESNKKTYTKSSSSSKPDTQPDTQPKSWTVTVDNGYAVVSGTGLTVVYKSEKSGDNGSAGANQSKNPGDFKMNDKKTTITMTISGLKAGQTISIKVSGFSGSAEEDSNKNKTGNYKEVDLTATATNATAAATNAKDNKVTFPYCTSEQNKAKEMGTFVYTVNADGTVTFVFTRVLGATTRVTGFDVNVA